MARIGLIDDDPLIRELVGDLFGRHGHAVTAWSSLAAATLSGLKLLQAMTRQSIPPLDVPVSPIFGAWLGMLLAREPEDRPGSAAGALQVLRAMDTGSTRPRGSCRPNGPSRPTRGALLQRDDRRRSVVPTERRVVHNSWLARAQPSGR